jgi:hypothetical protein
VVGHDMAHCSQSNPRGGLSRPHESVALPVWLMVVVARVGVSADIDLAGGTMKRLVLIALLFWPTMANATATMMGQGGASCGLWTQYHPQKENVVAASLEAWVLGYLSATNLWLGVMAKNPDADILKGQDRDGLMAWVDNYCAKNPLEKINTAAQELGKELAGKH